MGSFHMDIGVVKNALGSLDKLLSNAKSALWDIERGAWGASGFGEGGGYEFPRSAMATFLEELHDILLVILEAANLPGTRTSLVEAWRGFLNQGLQHTDNNQDLQTCESPALTYFERLIQGLRMAVSKEMSSEEAWTLGRLEAMLRGTSALVHRRGPAPAKEAELQATMHDYLSACFSGDFIRIPIIGGVLKNFKPDCGIRSVGAAIEFKFVRDKKDVSIASSGIFEDTAGYKGSKDWTRFYSVIYQAEPFMMESELEGDLKRIGAVAWKPIVVNGQVKGSIKGQAKRTSNKA
jgi:hypothetical protein